MCSIKVDREQKRHSLRFGGPGGGIAVSGQRRDGTVSSIPCKRGGEQAVEYEFLYDPCLDIDLFNGGSGRNRFFLPVFRHVVHQGIKIVACALQFRTPVVGQAAVDHVSLFILPLHKIIHYPCDGDGAFHFFKGRPVGCIRELKVQLEFHQLLRIKRTFLDSAFRSVVRTGI